MANREYAPGDPFVKRSWDIAKMHYKADVAALTKGGGSIAFVIKAGEAVNPSRYDAMVEARRGLIDRGMHVFNFFNPYNGDSELWARPQKMDRQRPPQSDQS